MKKNKYVSAMLVLIILFVLVIGTKSSTKVDIQEKSVPLSGNNYIEENVYDKNVIPDKYNSGCSGELTAVEFTDGYVTLGNIKFAKGTGYYGDTIALDYNRNKNLEGTYTFENYDFSDYVFNTYRTDKYESSVNFVFKNCNFSRFSNGILGDGDNVTYTFENCSFNICIGSNMSFDKCSFGNSYEDGLIPYQNVEVSNSYFANFGSTDEKGTGYHSDGTQIYGRSDVAVHDISYKNCRFINPCLGDGVTNKANACVMIQLEYNDAQNISVDGCYLNGGGYSIYAWDKNTSHTLENVTLSNLKIGVGYMMGVIYPNISSGVSISNNTCTSTLYVGSVWKEDGTTHISVSNETAYDSDLRVVTDKGEFEYTIDACPNGDQVGQITDYSEYPEDIDIEIPEDCNYVICYDERTGNSQQIRFVNWTDEKISVESAEVSINESSSNAETIASGSCGKNVEYTLDSNGKLKIEGTGATYNYHSKNRAPWYSDYRFLITSVEVGNGITKIGNQLFNGCTSLKEISLPDSLEEIGAYTFTSCSMLETITIPENVTLICDYAFSKTCVQKFYFAGDEEQWSNVTVNKGNDTVLEIVSFLKESVILSGECGKNATFKLLKNGLITIEGIGATYNYDSKKRSPWYEYRDDITGVVIGDGITKIGNQNFVFCSNIEKIILGNDLETIGGNCFYKCGDISSLYVTESVTTIGSNAFFKDTFEEVSYEGDEEEWNYINILDNNGNISEVVDYLGE